MKIKDKELYNIHDLNKITGISIDYLNEALKISYFKAFKVGDSVYLIKGENVQKIIENVTLIMKGDKMSELLIDMYEKAKEKDYLKEFVSNLTYKELIFLYQIDKNEIIEEQINKKERSMYNGS